MDRHVVYSLCVLLFVFSVWCYVVGENKCRVFLYSNICWWEIAERPAEWNTKFIVESISIEIKPEIARDALILIDLNKIDLFWSICVCSFDCFSNFSFSFSHSLSLYISFHLLFSWLLFRFFDWVLFVLRRPKRRATRTRCPFILFIIVVVVLTRKCVRVSFNFAINAKKHTHEHAHHTRSHA